ncbi:MAG TPA: metal-binding protein, partial [Planktothrix sp. UBA8402]|nr:metal-binding protein [Planktothrix sp. UBA8402]
WVPYQKSLRHRSFLSHGPFIGTALRILYLGSGIGILGFLGLMVGQYLGLLTQEPLEIFQNNLRSLSNYPRESIAIYLGLEMGAMSHSFSDWSNSFYKEFSKWLKTGATHKDIIAPPQPKKPRRQVSESSTVELPPIKPKRQKQNSTTVKKSSRRPKK